MKALKILAYIVDRGVWAVGCSVITFYANEHWPLALRIVIGSFILGFGIWYVWRFFVQPFREGLRGE